MPYRWDELTASDWPAALERSARTCTLPIGILEKHGPHAPIGSDLIHVREWSARAAPLRQDRHRQRPRGQPAAPPLFHPVTAGQAARLPLRSVKADTQSLALQNEFFDRVDKVGK
jgi:creatinine amidohydrolase/Fe(II)-dependent formamide hydrolase-like protein